MLGPTILDEAMIRWLNDLAPQGILVTDNDLIIRGWNRWLESHSARSGVHLVGMDLFAAFPELRDRGLDTFFRSALEGQVNVLAQALHGHVIAMPPRPGEKRFSHMQQSARIAPLFKGKNIVGTVTVIDDVTERVSRERDLEAARAEAEEANRAKDEFLAMVSHELRSPISAIVGWAQIMKTKKLEEQSLSHAIEVIERNSSMQLRLIEDLLDITRVISGKLRLAMSDVDLEAIAKSVVDNVSPAAVQKGVTIRAVFPELKCQTKGDPRRLEQVVANLLSNAVKFTPKGGAVTLTLTFNASTAVLSVRDTGQGIDPVFMPFVFDRFKQADSSMTRRQEGLGLGLAIVRYLIEMHGGTVQAESDGVDKGSVFTITLPLRQSSNHAVDRNEQNHSSSLPKGLRVLVVEDRPDTREVLREMLLQHGAQVTTASSALKAREKIKVEKPDAMVVDIGMPDEDGFSFIQDVRRTEVEAGGHIPAIALSAYAGEDNVRKALSMGFGLFLAKPVNGDSLVSALSRLVGGIGVGTV